MGIAESSYLLRNQPAAVKRPRELLALLSIAYQGDAYGVCRNLGDARESARQSHRTFADALAALTAAGLVERIDSRTVRITDLRHQERPGFVYVLSCEARYKIGAARDVSKRVANLQTGAPAPLRIVWAAEVRDMFATERALHTRFAHRHIAGEWYALTPDDLASIAQE